MMGKRMMGSIKNAGKKERGWDGMGSDDASVAHRPPGQ